MNFLLLQQRQTYMDIKKAPHKGCLCQLSKNNNLFFDCLHLLFSKFK